MKINNEFNKAIICNYISLIFMAISGLMFNAVIAFYYGSDALGIFSETYAWYTVLSQVSVWGIHTAIVKYVPESSEEKQRGTILKTGLVLVLIMSLVVTIVSEFAVFCIDSIAWKKSMQIAFSGLVLFSINKVLSNYLNALCKMVDYAIVTSVRYIFFGLWILLLSIINVEPDILATVFPVSELCVFIVLLIIFFTKVRISGNFDSKISRTMFCFGTKIMPSYMVLEMNTKVDIICLGALVSDVSKIGIYSFAIFFADGFYMLYTVIRKIINPDIAKSNAKGTIVEDIKTLNKKLKKYLLYGGATAYVGISSAYLILCFILGKAEYQWGVIYILIICLSIALNGKYIVFGDLLAQAGFPLEESVLNIITVIANLILNTIFIIFFGTIGASIATAISHFIFSFYIKARAKNLLGIII